ncbi:uncharacterized protein [Prorops nasuta]|uniref:uncharacterized protein n=1 Tax=Prorops nasuta TaxID=863751 RepID=UPI0034CD3D57
MFKLCILFGIVVAAMAAPAPAPAPGALLAAPAILPATPLITSSSSQYFARNYNSFAAAPLAYAATYSYPAYPAYSAYSAYHAPLIL